MKILVTGGSGYIGSSLIKRLRRRYSFVNFDIRNNRRDNVLNLARLKKAVRGVDGVVHLAAISRPKWGFENPHKCITTNIVGTLNVAEAVHTANPNCWIIFASSREVFGGLKRFPATEKSLRRPLNAYGVSKVSGEDILKQYAQNYGLRCLTLRFCGVYTGPRDILDRVIPNFILRARAHKKIFIEGSGEGKFDYVYINDVLEGLTQAIRFINSRPRGFYDDIDLVAHKPVSLKELAQLIIRLSKSRSIIDYLPERSYDAKNFWGSFAKAQRLLNWRPATSLEDGIRRVLKDLKPLAHDRGFIK